MFQWNEEKLRFMEDAAAWGDFHARLAATLAPYLPGDGHICDAGCGTGHLSLALSPYVRQVTAVDVSGEALALLAENCRTGIRRQENKGKMGTYPCLYLTE